MKERYSLKTNIRDERVCSMETSGTALTPEHSSRHCRAERGVRGFNGQANGLWTVTVDYCLISIFLHRDQCRGPRSLLACPLHVSSGGARGVAGGSGSCPPYDFPFPLFFFPLSAQRSVMAMIIPLPHSENVLKSEKKNVSESPPPPHPT